MKTLATRLLLGAALASLGCRSEAREALAGDGGGSSAAGAEPWWCGALHEPARVEKRKLTGSSPLRIGLVADAKEALASTLVNLERFAAAFKKQRVAAVVALGGLGASEEEIARVLGALRGAGAPLFALPGDREPEDAFHAAVARARRVGLDVVDLAETRRVIFDGGAGLVLLSLPGYSHPSYLGARASGCRYRSLDVDALVDWVAPLDSSLPGAPRLFVSHTPPRGHGALALDWALGGANIGDPDLARVLPKLGATVAAFAHVDEAGGQAWSGSALIEENRFVAPLWLNVGAADSVPHELNRGGLARGQAALVEISDGKARYQVVRP